ncbi:alanine--tRNA ligase-related protein, partial [Phytohabitans suffuscus]
MADQRARAKADARARKTGHADLSAYRVIVDRHGPTRWLAYDTLTTDSAVLALQDAAGVSVSVAEAGDIVTVFLDSTPFYAESGGQHADAGTLSGDSVEAEVLDVQRPVKGLVAHQVRIVAGALVISDRVRAGVDPQWRLGARQAHTGTHLVHAALRQVLGPTALQSGSFNRPGYLRLDFAWPTSLSATLRGDIEQITNSKIRDDLPVTAAYMPLAAARERGALALFGETYDEVVRVVQIDGPWSRELCGGTHVEHTAQVGPLAVTAQASVGAGVRRIEAVTGLEAFTYLARERDLVTQLAEQLRAPREELPGRVEALIGRAKSAERRAERLQRQLLHVQARQAAAGAVTVGPYAYASASAGPEVNPRQLAEFIRDALPFQPGIAAVAARTTRATQLVVAANPAAVAEGADAARLVNDVLGSHEGGNPALAQGGRPGAEPGNLLAALGVLLARTC